MPILALQQRNKVIVFHVTFGSQKSKDQWLATKISFCKTYIFNNSPKHSRHIQSTMLLVDFSYISATTSKFPFIQGLPLQPLQQEAALQKKSIFKSWENFYECLFKFLYCLFYQDMTLVEVREMLCSNYLISYLEYQKYVIKTADWISYLQ